MLSLPLISSAQTMANTGRWEVGVDALSLFDKNTLPAYSLFGRFRLNPNGEKESFIRTRIGYQNQYFEMNAPNENRIYETQRSVSLATAIGFQKEIISFSNSSMYLGGDFLVQRRREDEFVILFSERTGTWDREFNAVKVMGVVGISTRPTNHLKLSFESSLFGGKNHFQEDYLGREPNGEINTIGDNSSKRTVFGFQPFYQILVTLTL